MIGMSSQIHSLISKAETKTEFDSAIVGDLNLVTQSIYSFNEQVQSNEFGGMMADKEDRALRMLINQIEDRIEVLARHRTEDIITRKSLSAASEESSIAGSIGAASSPASATSKQLADMAHHGWSGVWKNTSRK